MARSRDAFKRDTLAIGDIVLVWVGSFLVALVLLGAILCLAPSVISLEDTLSGFLLGLALILGIDATLLLGVMIWTLVKKRY